MNRASTSNKILTLLAALLITLSSTASIALACGIPLFDYLCTPEGFFGAGVDENGNSYDIVTTEDCFSATLHAVEPGGSGSLSFTGFQVRCGSSSTKIIYDPDGNIVAQINNGLVGNFCAGYIWPNPPQPCTVPIGGLAAAQLSKGV